MKILIVSSYFGNVLGGALNFVKDLYFELESRNHLVTLMLDDRYKKLFSEQEFNIIWYSSKEITAYSPSLSFLKQLSRIDVDVIHLNGYMSFQTDFGSFIGFLRKIPLVITPHGSLLGYDYLYDSSKSKIPYHIHDILTMKLPTKFAKYVIATSKAEFDDCKKFGISKNKIKLIPLSFTLKNINISEKVSFNTKNILFVGRIVPLKNLDKLIKSIAILKKDFPNIKFTIVGDEIKGRLLGDVGYKKQLEILITKLNLDENINFVGWTTDNALWEYYSKSDLFLFGSTYENFGRPLLEAAFFRIPLVSTNVGVARDLIGDDQGGIILKNLDEQYVSDNIKELLTNEKKYQKASKHVKSSANNFSIKNVCDKYEKIFQEVIKN
ncbi:hypothetical protein C5F47_00715 [Nitrosopumilus cobalaminigenes]|uniref:Glycosyl transferase family 1 n=1 Tax=Nitrosopumilus cobalaminigenes TaxID=1470066 RepID=A0A7D5RAX2_9ARCH|nr:glycosyltransferase family 4 protein [Nitrosopumilus cobalaminigenes]QLH02205.1 hypothetical protein C5F47_00715 [Nitrosopumilus cobalaminigenes]